MSQLSLNTLRCEALFASTLQRSDDLERGQVQAVIMAAVRELGPRGCAARVAQEFGDHPDTAVLRMRWACGLVDRLYGRHVKVDPSFPPTAPITAALAQDK